MTMVIQIRGVPDDVHEALSRAAAAEGLSLSGYARRELEHTARRAARARHNATIARDVQRQIEVAVDRGTIRDVLDEERPS